MIDSITQEMILRFHADGKSRREISHILGLSRNTVKTVLNLNGIRAPAGRKCSVVSTELIDIVKILYKRCNGNIVRVKEVLAEEYATVIAYSTLTDWVRRYDIREPPKRSGTYYFEPGEEMQHDTSTHYVIIDGKKVKTQCASLILGYSRKLYVQYYPRFTRFEAHCFLASALQFMNGSCKRCVIDNTSVILRYGSGADAIICIKMETFSRIYGFKFMAHEIKHSDRKGKIERPFSYIENNFLAGRTFKSWDDLNAQAEQWCIQVANAKEKRHLGISPAMAFVQESPYLIKLPNVLPPVYEHFDRIVDNSAFVNVDCNRYSAPEKYMNKIMDVYKYPKEIRIFYKNLEVARHVRVIGQKNQRRVLEGHHQQVHRNNKKRLACHAEFELKGADTVLDSYIAELKKNIRGRGVRKFEKLLDLKRTYPTQAFLNAITQAHKYHLYDLTRVEQLIIKYAAGNYFNLKLEEHDDE